jgi:putative cell wall-binding protein
MGGYERSSADAGVEMRAKFAFALSVLLTAYCLIASLPAAAVAATSGTPSWSQLAVSSPPHGRAGAAMGFDPATGQLLLQGGYYYSGVEPQHVSDTWTFDGASWSQHITTVAPDTSGAVKMAYDPASRQMVLSDGSGTWTWNGSQWTRQQPTTTGGLYWCMATDLATGQLVMFSGPGPNPAGLPPGPFTSTWRNGDWVQLAPPNAPAAGPCEMTYDAARQVLVLVKADGYYGDIPDTTPTPLETWTFDGTTWTLQSTSSPTGSVDFGTMTYDPALGEVVTFGGQHIDKGNIVVTNPYAWNGATWQPLPATTVPPAREAAAMAYDDATAQLVLFGGYNGGASDASSYTADTWTLSSSGASSATPTRVSGANRQQTAVAASQAQFPTDASANAVVLARADDFADALAGGPLAAAKDGPLLLTSSGALDDVTKAEIERVLPSGGTVYLLGGTSALSSAVASQISALGDVATRVAGSDRFATAVAVASELGNPSTVFEVSGTAFPDAVSAVPAAIQQHAAILLTNSTHEVASTSAYLAAHATMRYAVGGPAAWADPSAIALAGADRYATSEAVALAFFPTTDGVDIASGAAFPDALAAGPVAGANDQPVLLAPPSGALPEPLSAYLSTHAANISSVQVFGGAAAVSDAVASEIGVALRP